MGYFNAIVDYLKSGPEPDLRVAEFARLLDIRDQPTEQNLEFLIRNPSFSQSLSKGAIRRFKSAKEMVERIEQNPEITRKASPALVDLAVQQSKGELVGILQATNPEEYSKFLLGYLKYDIDSLQESEETFWPELISWAQNRSRYIPFRDFFDPNFKNDCGEYTNPYGPYMHLKKGVRNGLESMLAMTAATGGLMAAPLMPLLTKIASFSGGVFFHLIKFLEQKRTPHDLMRNDFNFFGLVNFLADSLRQAFDGLDDLKKRITERKTIAWIENGGARFYVESLLTGLPDKNMESQELEKKELAIKPASFIIRSYSDSSLQLLYSPKFAPSNNESILVPFGYSPNGTNGNSLTFSRTDWNLDHIKSTGMTAIDLPDDLVEKIRNYDGKVPNINEIKRDLSSMFEYGYSIPNPLRTRFENAAFAKKGVCQDVNFLLWYILRSLNVPSFLALGFVEENDKITTDDGHAVVIAKEDGEWNIYDATPPKRERDSKRKGNLEKKIKGDIKQKHKSNLKELIKTLAGEIRIGYRDFKDNAYKKMVKMQSQHYHDLLAELDREVDLTDNLIFQELLRFSDDQDLYSNLASISREDLYFMDNISGISLLNYTDDARYTNVFRLFRPSQVRKAIKSFKYYKAAFPEYAQRMDNFSVSLDILTETIKTQGVIYPWDSSQNGEWTGLITSLFKLSGLSEEPPSPRRVNSPSRIYLKAKPSITIKQKDKDGKEAEIEVKRPRHIVDRRIMDKRAFYRKGGWHSLQEIDKMIKDVYGVPEEEMVWYHSTTENVDLSPSQLHYTYSPEILAFDEELSQKNKEYWEMVGQVIQSHIKSREFNLPLVLEALTAVRTRFKNGGESHYLSSRYSTSIVNDFEGQIEKMLGIKEKL